VGDRLRWNGKFAMFFNVRGLRPMLKPRRAEIFRRWRGR
jgi:hypothetical protein